MRRAIQTLRTNTMRCDLENMLLLVVNYVITVNFGPHVDELLPRITMHNPAFRLSIEHFPSLIAKLSEPRTTAMVFVTGCAVLVGSKSEQEAIFVAQWTRNEFEQYRRQYMPNMDPRAIVFGKLQTVNIVNTCTLPREICPIDLGMYAAKHRSKWCNYNPKKFSGCKIEYPDEKITVVVFEEGNLNMVGCKSQQIAINRARALVEELAPYKTTPRESSKNIVAQRKLEFKRAKELVGGWPEDSDDSDNSDGEKRETAPLELQELVGADVLNMGDDNFLESVFGGAIINLT